MLSKENFDDLFCQLIKSLDSCRGAIDKAYFGQAERHLNQAKWIMGQIKYLVSTPKPQDEKGE